MSEKYCLFKDVLKSCPKNDRISEIHEKGIISIKNASKKRKDSLFTNSTFTGIKLI